MDRRTFFSAALALSTTVFATNALAADASGTFDRTLPVTGSPTVVVATGAGFVHINAASDGRVHIVGHVHVSSGWFSGSDQDSRVRQIVANPPINQSGNTVNIGKSDGNFDLFQNVTIDYDINTPRQTNVTVHSGSGVIEVWGIQAPVNAGSGSGSLHLALAASNDVQARTGSGSIHVEGVAGGLNASAGSGSIEVNGDPKADWRLSTGSGSIRLRLADNAHFTLNASTGSGSVHVDQPITMQGSSHHHVTGNVNGGGPMLRATTGSGSITVNGNYTAAQLGDHNSLHVPGATDCVDDPAQPSCRK